MSIKKAKLSIKKDKGRNNGITGVFKDAVVNVNGFNITMRGNVIDGVTKIGTAFMA